MVNFKKFVKGQDTGFDSAYYRKKRLKKKAKSNNN